MSPPRGLWWTLGAFPARGHPSLSPSPGPSLCRSGCPMRGPYQFSHRLHTPAQREPPPQAPPQPSRPPLHNPLSFSGLKSTLLVGLGVSCWQVRTQQPREPPVGRPGAIWRVPSGRGHQALDDVWRQLCVRGPSPGPLAVAWSSGQYFCARPTRPPSSVLSPRCAIRHFSFELCCRGHTSGPDSVTFSYLEETLGRSPWGEGGSIHALGEHRSGCGRRPSRQLGKCLWLS